jgi:hypothetical protein
MPAFAVTCAGRRRQIHFTHHALDRFWDSVPALACAGRRQALAELERQLQSATRDRQPPAWSVVTRFYAALTDHYLEVESGAFPVVRDPGGGFVAVTFLSEVRTRAGAKGQRVRWRPPALSR